MHIQSIGSREGESQGAQGRSPLITSEFHVVGINTAQDWSLRLPSPSSRSLFVSNTYCTYRIRRKIPPNMVSTEQEDCIKKHSLYQIVTCATKLFRMKYDAPQICCWGVEELLVIERATRHRVWIVDTHMVGSRRGRHQQISSLWEDRGTPSVHIHWIWSQSWLFYSSELNQRYREWYR